MPEIIVSDIDVADANINLAKNYLIRAYSVSEIERKINSLLFALNSVEMSLKSLGVDIQDINVKRISVKKSKSEQSKGNLKKSLD